MENRKHLHCYHILQVNDIPTKLLSLIEEESLFKVPGARTPVIAVQVGAL